MAECFSFFLFFFFCVCVCVVVVVVLFICRITHQCFKFGMFCNKVMLCQFSQLSSELNFWWGMKYIFFTYLCGIIYIYYLHALHNWPHALNNLFHYCYLIASCMHSLYLFLEGQIWLNEVSVNDWLFLIIIKTCSIFLSLIFFPFFIFLLYYI